jgi:hypothetical protein
MTEKTDITGTDPVEVTEVAEVTEQPKGRGAVLARYREANPEGDDPDDEALFDYADSSYADLDGRHKKITGANTRLAELVAKDPKLGAVLSMVAGEKPSSFPYAVARVYGKQPFDLEGEALEDFEKGYQENLKALAENETERQEAMRNIAQYDVNLKKYASDNALDETRAAALHEALMDMAENFLAGKISPEVIDLVHKGVNHDSDIREAADTGFVEGKNERVQAKLKKVSAEQTLPDLKGNTSAGTSLPGQRKKARGGSVFDSFEEIPGTAPTA